ncbi:EF-hand domain-containing protein [Maioricimonas rarisocia]|nr:EF-hand domain-containing protein [Maioricimonas rarisocia]
MNRGIARVLLVGGIVSVLAEPTLAQFRGGGPSPERIVGFIDRNQDGHIDGEELRRMPGPFREALEDAGVDTRRGISREQFLREAPRLMESMRRRMEESRERGGDRGRDDDRDRRDGRDRDDRDRDGRDRDDDRRRGPERPQRPARKQREPVTLTIPEQFSTIDQDVDGQVAFYEWRQTQHGTISQFMAIDRNGDGFLTPFELKLSLEQPADAPATPIAAGTQPGSGPPQVTIPRPTAPAAVAATRTAPSPPSSTATSSPTEVDMESPEAARAKYTFRLLDRNRDGSIAPEEWQRSRRLRPLFEEAGTDLSQPMTVEQFVPIYLKVNNS